VFLPSRVPVTQIAGDITVSRSFFGLHAYDISLGSDTIVPDDSQHGYIDSAAGSPLGLHTSIPTVTCTEPMDSLLARGGARLGRSGGCVGSVIGGLSGTELQLLADGKAMEAIGNGTASAALVEFLLRAYVGSDCAHTAMPTNPRTITEIVEALRAQAAPLPLQPTDLLNAPIPASCQHPAGRLVNGDLPLAPNPNGPDPGFATVYFPETHRFIVQPVLSDVTGDGVADLTGVLMCSAGGVSWPELVLVYTTGIHLLGYVDLGTVTPHEHDDVTAMSAAGHDIRLTWTSYEGCCMDKQIHTGLLHWTGSQFVMRQVT
jgi:hypothetical protein